jgi:hypothetical protein
MLMWGGARSGRASRYLKTEIINDVVNADPHVFLYMDLLIKTVARVFTFKSGISGTGKNEFA